MDTIEYPPKWKSISYKDQVNQEQSHYSPDYTLLSQLELIRK